MSFICLFLYYFKCYTTKIHILCSQLSVNSARQFKLMEEFRVCTVEAQAATEDIREEISAVVAIFNSRHQNVRRH